MFNALSKRALFRIHPKFEFLVVLPQGYFVADVFGGPHSPQILFINTQLFPGRGDYLFGEKKLFLFMVGLEKGAAVFLIFLLLLVRHILFDPFHTLLPIILKL